MSKIKKNYSFQLVYQIVSFLSVIIITPYLSRKLGVNNIGITSYITANVTYFTLFGNLGVFGYGQREVSYNRDDRKYVSRLFWEIEAVHFFSYVIVSLCYFVLIFVSQKYRIFYLISYITILSSLVEINWFFQAYEDFSIISLRNIIVKILTMATIFLLVKEKNDIYIYMLISGVSLLISNGCMWTRVRKYVDFVPLEDIHPMKHVKGVAIYFLPTIAGSVYSILDKSVINWITNSEAENGYYEQGYKLLMLTNVVVQSFSTVLAPAMTYLVSKKDVNQLRLKLYQALQFMLFISIGTAFGMFSIAKDFVPVFFGNEYYPVVNILYVFSPLVIVLGFSVYLDGLYLVPIGKRKESAYAVCIGAISNIILNTGFVYFLGALGAAIATLITESIVTSIMMYLSKDIIRFKDILNMFFKYLLAGFVMSICIYCLSIIKLYDIVKLTLEIGIGVLVYIGILFVVKDKMVEYILNTIRYKINSVKQED